jgi:hypothetical protein
LVSWSCWDGRNRSCMEQTEVIRAVRNSSSLWSRGWRALFAAVAGYWALEA